MYTYKHANSQTHTRKIVCFQYMYTMYYVVVLLHTYKPILLFSSSFFSYIVDCSNCSCGTKKEKTKKKKKKKKENTAATTRGNIAITKWNYNNQYKTMKKMQQQQQQYTNNIVRKERSITKDRNKWMSERK